MIVPRTHPTQKELFLEAPIFHLTTTIFHFFARLTPAPAPKKFIRIVCISDTHNRTPPSIPNGDILIHAGDLSQGGTVPEIQAQIDWLDSLPHKTKILIAGNHDSWMDPSVRSRLPAARAAGTLDMKSIVYLEDASAAIDVVFLDDQPNICCC